MLPCAIAFLQSGGQMPNVNDPSPEKLLSKLKCLTLQNILQIEESLQKVGPFGQVRLVKKDGELKFIQRLESISFGNDGVLDEQ